MNMVTSKIKCGAYFGARTEVTSLPFVAPQNGIVHIILGDTNTDPAYAYYNGNRRLMTINGFTNSGAYPITKGESLELIMKSSNASVTIYYTPLLGGG